MINNKKTTAIALGIFALVIVTTAASYAFFNYSRVGNTTTTITSGDIEFSFVEGEDASLVNAFPVSDSVGAKDTTEEYSFTVNLKSTSASNKMNYNVYLLDNNKEGVDYFNNEQIEFVLIKDGTYVAGTSDSEGKKLIDVPGFTEGEHNGEGIVLEQQEILAGKTDEYKLRIWISDDVKYTNTNPETGQDEQTSIGKFNGYKYSLKVKVTSETAVVETGTIRNLKVNNLTMTVDLHDDNGISAYAVTQNETAPASSSSEWINLTSTAKSNVVRTSTITTKSIEFMVKKNGKYYLHVKNVNDEVASRTFTTNATGENAVDKIVGLAETNTNELRIDDHEPTGQQTFATKEYRYYGASPNNYVWFNNELWRIIGAMDVDDGSNPDGPGNVDKRLKIVRNDIIGNYSWDLNSANSNNGINEWSQADAMNLLNSGPYYSRTTGTCNVSKTCDFSNTGLTDEAKELIGNSKWYLGAINSNNSGFTTANFYAYERGFATGKDCSTSNYCNDSVTRTNSWTGKIGLMYPSDYGYSANMNSCSNVSLISYKQSCKNSVWLYKSSVDQWLLSPLSDSGHALYVYFVSKEGSPTNYDGWASSERGILPTTYLLPSIKILDGDGSINKPFILSK